MKNSYVLITAAWNEERYIRHTVEAVVNQTILPAAWIVVSDGSTDRTDEIVKEAALRNGFIVFVRKERNQEQLGFASKVHAITEGLKHLDDVSYSFIGHLDSDVSFASDYYEQMLKRFADDPHLGIGGGFIFEERSGHFKSRPSNTVRSVAGAIQLFRRECYEDISGLRPLALGGEDWCAEIMARMKGWQVKAEPTLIVLHHKPSLTSRGIFAENFRQGLVDHSFGSHPLFELAKCTRRAVERPYLIGAFVRLIGYLFAHVRRIQRPVPPEVVHYLRAEQLGRLR